MSPSHGRSLSTEDSLPRGGGGEEVRSRQILDVVAGEVEEGAVLLRSSSRHNRRYEIFYRVIIFLAVIDVPLL